MFAIAEAYPFAKVGGLADVGAGLPKALARRGHEVRLVLPGYRHLPRGATRLVLDVPLGRSRQPADVGEHGVHEQVSVWSLAPEGYFADGQVYGYSDTDVAPFIAFGKAVVELAARWEWRPDIIHGHDWHLGLVPQYARQGPHRQTLRRTATLLTIHNLAYQGYLGKDAEALIGLPDGEASLLARGIVHADVVTTVSRRYLQEILAPQGGMGLDGLLRRRAGDVFGVLNGLDYEEFDPATDVHVAARFDATSPGSKHLNKAALQAYSGLPIDPAAPLIGMVTRLVEQKGIRLVCASLDALVSRGAQVVIMGLGEEGHKRALEAAAQRHPRAVAYHATRDEALARQVYAGSDLFLAPSEFEPCGLSALIALRYGAVPIVRRTGGLAETIRDSARDPHTGLGFTFARKSPRALLGAVDRALAVYARADDWRVLQQRGMAARFAWDEAAASYERLYAAALARRESQPEAAQQPRPAIAPRAPRPSARRPIPVAFVHHANQYLVADGYDDRQGITRIVQGYRNVLDVHHKHAIPANLHLSGTLIEALAWHCPEFLTHLRARRAQGQLGLIGGTYSENVMPLFGPAFNRRQLEELFWLYRRHLACPPADLAACWVPERVWNPSAVGSVLTDEHLPNGGYRYVLLDDRLVYATNGAYPGSPRAGFDARPDDRDADASLRLHRVANAPGLIMVPISARFRRAVPPRLPEHWQAVQNLIERLARRRLADALLVYADDLERTAGVGGWDGAAFEQYAAFLQWLRSRDDVVPVVLTDWLAKQAEPQPRPVEAGTFFELGQEWGAREDYSGWSDDAAWAPYRRVLRDAERAVTDAEQAGADRRLVRLAWKHLLASGYETAWHDWTALGRAPAPWARAIASHARACLVILAAARWFAQPRRCVGAELVDLDADGEDEVVIRNEHLFAVLTPEHGGRLVYLFARTPRGGLQVVGNPSDDWNLQEELNRFMDRPPNHPGALTEVGFEHDRYRVAALSTCGERASLELTNTQPGSTLRGLTKRLSLVAGEQRLTACYTLPAASTGLVVRACLSPDYLRLLRHGRRGVRRLDGPTWRGARNGNVAVWLARPADEATAWTEPVPAEAGHGLNVRLEARADHFHLIFGCGRGDDGAIRDSLTREAHDANCLLRA